MKSALISLVAIGTLAAASVAVAQTTGTTPAAPAPAATKPAPARDLNKEAEAMKSSSGSTGTPTTSVKEQRGKLETPEQKAAAMKEMQSRSTSSAGAQPAVVDKNAPKQNPRKAYKDMTPEEKRKLEAAAKEASKP